MADVLSVGNVATTFSARLFEAMQAAGMVRERGGRATPLVRELAQELRVASSTISRYLNDVEKRPDVDVADALAKRLGVRFRWLVFGEGPMRGAEEPSEAFAIGAAIARSEGATDADIEAARRDPRWPATPTWDNARLLCLLARSLRERAKSVRPPPPPPTELDEARAVERAMRRAEATTADVLAKTSPASRPAHHRKRSG